MKEIKKLPGDPDQIIEDVALSDAPEKTAYAYSVLLATHYGKPGDTFWIKAGCSLLTLLVLYVSKAEEFIAAHGTNSAVPSGECGSCRTASELADCILCDPEKLQVYVKRALTKNSMDYELLHNFYYACFMNRNYRDIAAGIALQAELIDYLRKNCKRRGL